MDIDKIIKLIQRVAYDSEWVGFESVKRKKGVTKQNLNNQKRAIKDLFVEITGRKPTAEELKIMTSTPESSLKDKEA